MRKSKKAVKACPLCGGRIKVCYLYQYSLDYKITKSGRLSKKYTRTEGGPMDAMFACCESCDAEWLYDEFDVIDGRFIDKKYSGEEDNMSGPIHEPRGAATAG